MPKSHSEQYLRPYREAVKRFGPGFEATLWASADAQRLRFDIMIDLADLTGCTILDVGCGRGDFAARLIEREIPFERFVGLDAVPEMIEAARKRNLARSSFEVADVLGSPEIITEAGAAWICFSGTLNTMDERTARGLVGRAFDAAERGVLFNFLSDRCHARWRGRDTGPARRFNTLRWLDWAFSKSSRVAFTQAYMDGHDATIMIAKEE
jgi:SAM-dependent methyltransferase